MRKLFVGAVVGVFALAITAVALAVTEHNVTSTFTKNTTSTSAGIRFQSNSVDEENPKNQQPKAIRGLNIDLPAGTRIQPCAVPACTASDDELIQEGPGACAKKSTVGSGKATAKWHTSSLADVQVVVTAFAAKRGLILHFDPNVSNSFILRPKWTGKLTNGPVLETVVPANCVPPGRPQGENQICRDPNTGAQTDEVILNSFQLTTLAKKRGKGKKRKLLIRTPRKCKRTWTFRATYLYADGSDSDTLVYKQACKKR